MREKDKHGWLYHVINRGCLLSLASFLISSLTRGVIYRDGSRLLCLYHWGCYKQLQKCLIKAFPNTWCCIFRRHTGKSENNGSHMSCYFVICKSNALSSSSVLIRHNRCWQLLAKLLQIDDPQSNCNKQCENNVLGALTCKTWMLLSSKGDANAFRRR